MSYMGTMNDTAEVRGVSALGEDLNGLSAEELVDRVDELIDAVHTLEAYVSRLMRRLLECGVSLPEIAAIMTKG